MKKSKRITIICLAGMMTFMNALPVFAATSKYGEEKPLKSVQVYQLTVNAGHKHTYIKASNGCTYQLYDSCMDGMVGRTPTNHSSTVTIDGVNYSLCNYAYGNHLCDYASVIKRIGGAPAPKYTTKIPLEKITLSTMSFSIRAGSKIKLTVTYIPANTTDSKTVTWSSSNTSVATVSGGVVTAKKAGTATITAKVGSKIATRKVTVTAASTGRSTTTGSSTAKPSAGKYENVSEAYAIFNTFRTTKANQWYWNRNNTSKVKTYGLRRLSRDTALENIAKLRAKEQWTMYYEKGKLTHTRPNGQSWSTAYPGNLQVKMENLSWGPTSCSYVILNPTNGWAETNYKYSGQDHRRNMLDSRATKVGIACYVKNGKTCWAMCLGK